MMGRSGYIVLSVLSIAVWSWAGYFNISSALNSGTPYAFLSPSTVGLIGLIPLSLTQLWKLFTAERTANILDPDFVLRASQSLIAAWH